MNFLFRSSRMFKNICDKM